MPHILQKGSMDSSGDAWNFPHGRKRERICGAGPFATWLAEDGSRLTCVSRRNILRRGCGPLSTTLTEPCQDPNEGCKGSLHSTLGGDAGMWCSSVLLPCPSWRGHATCGTGMDPHTSGARGGSRWEERAGLVWCVFPVTGD